MGQMRNLELPVQMSPCVRLFIENLLDQTNGENDAASRQNREVQSALLKAANTEGLAMSATGEAKLNLWC
jgi:hypothetical protein